MGRWGAKWRWSREARCWLLGGMLLAGAMSTAACLQDPEPMAQVIDDPSAVREWVYHSAPAAGVALSAQEFEAMEESGAVSVTAPDDWDLRVVWGALRCNTAPTIRVSGTDTAIESIAIDYGVIVPRGVGCGDELVLHAVDLRIAPGSARHVVVSGRGS